jgi:hypothetical protein
MILFLIIGTHCKTRHSHSDKYSFPSTVIHAKLLNIFLYMYLLIDSEFKAEVLSL